MSRDESFTINSIIKESLTILLAEEPISDNEIKNIKEKIRQRLKNPKFSIRTNKLAELLIIYLIT